MRDLGWWLPMTDERVVELIEKHHELIESTTRARIRTIEKMIEVFQETALAKIEEQITKDTAEIEKRLTEWCEEQERNSQVQNQKVAAHNKLIEGWLGEIKAFMMGRSK